MTEMVQLLWCNRCREWTKTRKHSEYGPVCDTCTCIQDADAKPLPQGETK
jgi:hypothetical protein